MKENVNEAQVDLQRQTARGGSISVKLQHLPVEYFRPIEENISRLRHIGSASHYTDWVYPCISTMMFWKIFSAAFIPTS